MTEVSATVTAGIGSERHNHDLAYRESLDHTTTANCPDAIIELVPYEASYKAQINEIMKPFIDEYNAHQQKKLDAAWEKYRSGERKSKPKKKDFPMMDYDYFEAHKDDTIVNPHTKKVEKVPIFRSWIIGIGDITDRKNERITREQAEPIFKEFVQKFQEKFPHFKVLGATMHLDEQGFFHLHLDYKPVMEHTFAKGLQATTSQDTILESMGYTPEQSIINGRDKAPILFNALRNQMYYDLETAMANHGLRLQYGVTETKQPGHDSGKNMDMETWQDLQDAARNMQHQKNIVLESIDNSTVTPAGLAQALQAATNIEHTMARIEQSPKSRLDKKSRLVEFRLLDQLRSFVDQLLGAFHHVWAQLSNVITLYNDAADRAEAAEEEVKRLRPFEKRCQEQFAELQRLRGSEAELGRMRSFMRRQKNADGQNLDEVYQATTSSIDSKEK